MARWLALAVTDVGSVASVIVHDPEGTRLPFGGHEAIIAKMDGVEELTALVELPDGDFRPEVIDTTADQEAPVFFLDLA